MSSAKNTPIGLTIASKSIPRSGHHLLKEILRSGFRDNFVHCEWYYEPGCCRQIPCKLHQAYCEEGQTVQFIKSHDFTLDDPMLGVRDNVITLVSYRHPLWSLTSNFVYCLRQTEAQRLGIADKMSYLHEPAVVNELTNRCHEHLPLWRGAALNLWLAEQINYQIKFFRKWLFGESSRICFDETEGILNCPYEQIASINGARLLLDWLVGKSGIKTQHLSDDDFAFIRASRGPWFCSNDKVASFLHAHRPAFGEAASCIIREAGLSYASESECLLTDMPSTGILPDAAEIKTVTRRSGEGPSLTDAAIRILVEENMDLRRKCRATRDEAQQSMEKLRSIEQDLGVRAARKISDALKRFT
jgi:hypothetical protein